MTWADVTTVRAVQYCTATKRTQHGSLIQISLDLLLPLSAPPWQLQTAVTNILTINVDTL
jgi:hypothetical protein